MVLNGFSQVVEKITLQKYEQLKSSGQLDLLKNYSIIGTPPQMGTQSNQSTTGFMGTQSTNATNSTSSSGANCGCYIEPDSTYTLAMGPQDDSPSALVNLPFNFCFYGGSENTVYINNNGNISFGTAYSTFSASGFPSSSFKMVAPFWGDVDTRIPAGGGTGGQVLYKLTNTALIVNWVDVGYYNRQVDKRNTFQLIITNGNDPLVANGNNVAFCYKDMQWTTGSASNGVNGFGGTPATVGANKGDNVDYIQFGRFDKAGTSYDGPVGANDGISWLDNQSFYFNSCNNNNIPPIAAGVDFCDTLGICKGDTLKFNLQFLAPEVTQITKAFLTTPVPGLTLLSNTVGVNANIVAQLVGGPNNIGYNTIQFMAYDSGGVSTDTIYTDVVVFVDTTPVPDPTISGLDSLCVGDSTTLSVASGYDKYQWSTGPNDTTTSVHVPAGLYKITVTNGYCSKVADTFNIRLLKPLPELGADTGFCIGDSLLLTVPDTFDTYQWNLGDTDTNTMVTAPGYVKLTIEKWGCTGVDSVLVNQYSYPEPKITGDTSFCDGDSIQLMVADTFHGYNWTTGDLTHNAWVKNSGYIKVTAKKWGCEKTDSIQVYKRAIPNPVISGDTAYCFNDSVTLSVQVFDSVKWNTGDTSQQIKVGKGKYFVQVTTEYGCKNKTDTFNVEQSSPNPVIQGDTFFCHYDSTKLYIQSFDSIKWSIGSSTDTIKAGGGTHIVKVIDQYGCVAHDTAIVVQSIPNKDVIGDTLICRDSIANLAGGKGNKKYRWSNGDTQRETSVHLPGTYNLTVTDFNGCIDSNSITVALLPDPTGNFVTSPLNFGLKDNTIGFLEQLNLSIGQIVEWSWEFGDGQSTVSNDSNPTFIYSDTGTYTIKLKVRTSNGCYFSYDREIIIGDEVTAVNVITPNGDGKNDFLVFPYLEFYPESKLVVYNRWGRLVYENGNYQNDWDGGEMSDGVYYYVLQMGRTNEIKKGHFTLIKE